MSSVPGRVGLAWLLTWLGSLFSSVVALRVAKAVFLSCVAFLTSIRPVFAAGAEVLQARIAPQHAVETVSAGPRRGQRIGLLTPQGKVALLTGNAKWTPAQLQYKIPFRLLPRQPYESARLLVVTGWVSFGLLQLFRALRARMCCSRASPAAAAVPPSGLMSPAAVPRRLSLTGVPMSSPAATGRTDVASSSSSVQLAAAPAALPRWRSGDNFLRVFADWRLVGAIVIAGVSWGICRHYWALGSQDSVGLTVAALVLSAWLRPVSAY